MISRPLLERFMARFGASVAEETECLFTGGATAVLLGWRDATIDIDLALEPASDAAFRALVALKHELGVNVELAHPGDFVPAPPEHERRSMLVAKHGSVTFRHVDPYAQALAKIERGHARDLVDVAELAARGLIEPDRLVELHAASEHELHRFPAVDRARYRAEVARVAATFERPS